MVGQFYLDQSSLLPTHIPAIISFLMTRLGLDVAFKVFALASICTSIHLFNSYIYSWGSLWQNPTSQAISHPLSSSEVGKAEQAFSFLTFIRLSPSLIYSLEKLSTACILLVQVSLPEKS